VGVLGKVELLVECRSEGRHPVQVQRQPQPQPAELARELRAVGGEVGKGARLEVLQVGRVAAVVGGGEEPAVADQQAPCAEREEQALVRIEHERVGTRGAGYGRGR
jgi:hypothetical protein